MDNKNKVIVVVENDLASLIHLHCTKTRVGEENTLALFLHNKIEDSSYKMVGYCKKEKIKTFIVPVCKVYNEILNLPHHLDVDDLLQMAKNVKKRVVTDYTLDSKFPPMEFPEETKKFFEKTIKTMLIQAFGDILEAKIVGGDFYNPLKNESKEKIEDLAKFLGLDKEAKEMQLM